MSRSFKKNPIIKDNGNSHRYYKKQAHQAVRAKVKNLLGNSTPYEDLLFPTVKGQELVNQYDVCDYIWRLDTKPHIWIDYKGVTHIDKVTNKDILCYTRK